MDLCSHYLSQFCELMGLSWAILPVSLGVSHEIAVRWQLRLESYEGSIGTLERLSLCHASYGLSSWVAELPKQWLRASKSIEVEGTRLLKARLGTHTVSLLHSVG